MGVCLVQILSRRSTPERSSNRFYFIVTVIHAPLGATGLSSRPYAIPAVHRWTTATHRERRSSSASLCWRHNDLRIMCPRTNRSHDRSVSQHVSIMLLSGCVRTASCWTQWRPKFSGQQPVVVYICCRSLCFVVVRISSSPPPSSGTSAHHRHRRIDEVTRNEDGNPRYHHVLPFCDNYAVSDDNTVPRPVLPFFSRRFRRSFSVGWAMVMLYIVWHLSSTRLQSVMNAAARMIHSTSRFSHISPFLH